MTTTIEGTTVERITMAMVPAAILRGLATAAVAACTDGTLPTLTGVRFEWGPGFMRAVATDRYRLAIVEWNGTHSRFADNMIADMPEGTALVPAKELAAYVKALPKDKRNAHPHVVMMYPENGQVRFVCDTDGGEVSRTIRTLDGEFPKYQSLVPSEFSDLPATGIACNPGYLADVAKMPVERNCPVRVQFTGPTRPMVWSAGTAGDPIQWKYLLMPVRLAG